MSLPRQDVRLKLDAEVHEALKVIAEADGADLCEWVEMVVVREVTKRIHRASVIYEGTKRLRISGRVGDSLGAPSQ